MLYNILTTACCILILSLPFAGYAITSQERAISQQERLFQYERRQQEALEDQIRLERQKNAEDARKQQQETQTPDEDAPSPDSSACYVIDSMRLQGATLLPQSLLDRLFAPFASTCMSLASIDTLVDALIEAYIQQGYIMARIYIPQQDINDGHLDLVAVEGSVDGIILNDQTTADRLQIATAFPNITDHPLYLPAIEQGLDQMNRLRSNAATMRIVPGQEEGTSTIMLSNEVSGSTRITPGIDNAGQPTTGVMRKRLVIEQDNLLALNDGLLISLTQDIEHETLKGQESLYAQWSIPYGYWTLEASGSYSHYTTTFVDGQSTFLSEGKTSLYQLHAKRLLKRNQQATTSAFATVALRDINSYLGGRLTSSSRRQSMVTIGLTNMTRFDSSILNSELSLMQGLELFGAESDSHRSTTVGNPQAQFMLLRARSQYTLPFDLWDEQWSYSASVEAQYSHDPLYGSEKISMGDQYSIRGYRQDALQGDSGAFTRQTLYWNAPIIDDTQIQLFAGFDLGMAQSRGGKINNAGRQQGTIGGGSLGANATGRWFDTSITYARPLFAPDFIDHDRHEVYFSFSVPITASFLDRS